MDIVSFVVQPTWKELLIDLVSSEQMDPWDIDVGVVAQKYLELIRGLQSMDLRVPANVVLASALLLRFKSENLTVEEAVDDDTFEERALQDETLPELVFRVNRPRRRKMTLDELVRSLEDVIRKGKKAPSSNRSFLPALLIEVPELDMDQKMQKVYDKAIALKDSEGIVLFSALIEQKTPEQVARHLLPVLHLVQDSKVMAWQDKFFGEIFIKILDGQAFEEPQPVEAEAPTRLQGLPAQTMDAAFNAQSPASGQDAMGLPIMAAQSQVSMNAMDAAVAQLTAELPAQATVPENADASADETLWEDETAEQKETQTAN